MEKIDRVCLNLMRTLTKVILELEQIEIDVNHWNKINPQHVPIDSESNRLALDAAKRCLVRITQRQNCEAEWNQMLQFMQQE